MQPQHFVILISAAVGFALLTLFITKAIKRALSRAYDSGKYAGAADSDDRLNVLNDDLASLATRRTRERKGFLETIELKNQIIQDLQKQVDSSAACNLTKADLQVLIDTAATLGLAHKTWLPIKGTEPWRARAAAQLELLNGIAHRILAKNIRPNALLQRQLARAEPPLTDNDYAPPEDRRTLPALIHPLRLP